MKTKFLVRKFKSGNKFNFDCAFLPEVVVSESEENGLILLRRALTELLKDSGVKYIGHHKGEWDGDGRVNCPDAFVKLPIDVWCCKRDKAPCSAIIDPSDKEGFLEFCRADNKEGIFGAVEQKKYTGFHHVPGRYLCPMCDGNLPESKQYFKYHYPWELYPLWECVDFSDDEIRFRVIRGNVTSSVMHSKVCAPCFVKFLNEYNNMISQEFFVVEMEFKPT